MSTTLSKFRGVFAVLLLSLLLFSPTVLEVEAGGFFESGQVILSDTVDNGIWETVTYQKSYVNPVVVAGPVTHSNGLSLSVRLRNVTSTSFQIGLQSPCESAGGAAGSIVCPPAGGWASETIQYYVFEEGTWVFPDGREIEVDRHSTSTVRANFGGATNRGDVINFTHSYSNAPAVLHTIQTWNDSDWVTTTAWAPSGSSGNPPTSSAFRLALEGAEVSSTHAAETIGWVGIARGSGTNNGSSYDIGRTSGRVVDRHSDGCYSIGSFSFSGPPVVVSHHNSINGTNGGWFRACGAGVESTNINVHMDEDQVRDTERTGIPEYGAWFAFEVSAFGNMEFLTVTSSYIDDNGGLIEPGDTLTYTSVISNLQSDFSQVDNPLPELVVALPSGADYVTGSSSASTGILTFNPTLRRMEWNGSVGAGATVTISYQLSLTNASNCRTISQQAIVFMDPNLDGINSIRELGDDPSEDDGIDLDNDGATDDDDPISIQVTCTPESLPDTGFPPNRNTQVPRQLEPVAYTQTMQLRLQIPVLDIDAPIVGAPWEAGNWRVQWLGANIGYLEGTAFPTWEGNTVLSAHAYLTSGLPGPFSRLSNLSWDDEIRINSGSYVYSYRVRQSYAVGPEDTRILRHEELDWVTLVTCQFYSEEQDQYLGRYVVRAVLTRVEFVGSG